MPHDAELELFSRILLHFTFDGISPTLLEPELITAEARQGMVMIRQLGERGHQQQARELCEQAMEQVRQASEQSSAPARVFAEITNELLELHTKLVG